MSTHRAEAVLTVRDLHKQYGAAQVLRGVDLDVASSEISFIIGPSGAGKSSLLRCVNFLERPSSGEITLFGERLCHGGPGSLQVVGERLLRQARSRMPMVFQQFNLFHHLTVMQNLIEGPMMVHGTPRALAIEQAQQILRRVALLDKQDHYPDQLSGGERQRVAIARALAMQPALILFDEPTSSLDPELVGEVLSMIHALAEEGRTLIVVTHEMEFARQLASQVHFMVDGRIIESGPAEQIFEAPQSPRLADFIRSPASRHALQRHAAR